MRTLTALLFVVMLAGCGGGNDQAATPTPIVSLDDSARDACGAAATNAWLAAQLSAQISAVPELVDLAIKSKQTGNRVLIKEWCRKNYPALTYPTAYPSG